MNKHIKTYNKFIKESMGLGKVNLRFKKDTYLINVTFNEQPSEEDAVLTIKVMAGDILRHVSLDWANDNEMICDISNFSLNELLQFRNENITKIGVEDFSGYIKESNCDIVYNTNKFNGVVTSVSYEDIDIELAEK